MYLSKVYFCEMYPTCVSSKLCEFILLQPSLIVLKQNLFIQKDVQMKIIHTSEVGIQPDPISKRISIVFVNRWKLDEMISQKIRSGISENMHAFMQSNISNST